MDDRLNLKHFTQALASGITQVRLELSRILSGFYIRGVKDPREYGPLVFTGDIRKRIPQAYGNQLDLLGYMFNVKRRFFEKDETYRSRILFAVKVSATKYGLKNTLKFILEQSTFFKDAEFDIDIRESVEDYFDGYSAPINAPSRNNSVVGGMIIYINPVVFVKYYDSSSGKEVKERYDTFFERYVGKSPSEIPPFYKYSKVVDHSKVLEGGEQGTLRQLVETIVAAGIDIDRIVFQQPGSYGNKGEYYAYKL